MRINSITLQNFRQFEGVNTLDFSIDPSAPERNVFYFEGDNTTGKSTLESAFEWCLYGKNEFSEKTLLSYNLQQKMHRKCCDTSKKENEVAVSIEIEHNQKTIIIKRRALYKKSGGRIYMVDDLAEGLTMCIIRHTEAGESTSDPITNATLISMNIEELFPTRLSDYMFFKGEGLKKITDGINKSVDDGSTPNTEFRVAVEKLVGLDYLTQAISHMSDEKRGVIASFKRDLKGKNTNGRIKDLDCKVNSLGNLIFQKKTKLKTCREEITHTEEMLKQAETEIEECTREDKARIKDFEECKEQKEKTSAEIISTSSELIRKIVSEGLDSLVGTLTMGISPENKVLGDPKVVEISAELIDSLLERGVCICGRELTMEDRDTLTKLKTSLGSLRHTAAINEYKALCQIFKDKARGSDLKVVINEVKERLSKVRDLYDSARLALDKMDEAALNSTNERLKNATRQKLQAEQELREFQADFAVFSEEIRKLEDDLHQAQDALEIERRKEKSLMKLQKAHKYALAVLKHLNNLYTEESQSTRELFTQSVNDYFHEIFKSDLTLRVSENYCLQLFGGPQEERIDNSNGQGDTIVFSFIAAVQKMVQQNGHGFRYPLVMDAPFSNLDKDRIAGVCNMLANNFEQIFLFIKNVDGTYAKKYLEGRILRRFQLKKIDDYRTEIGEEQ